MRREDFKSSYWKQGQAEWADILTNRFPWMSYEEVDQVSSYVVGIIDAVLQDAREQNCEAEDVTGPTEGVS